MGLSGKVRASDRVNRYLNSRRS